MDSIKKLCDAISFLIMGVTACGFLTLVFFAQGGEIRLPAGNMPKELVPMPEGYGKHDRSALEAKYRQLFAEMGDRQ